ncbi:MAG: recombinase A [Acidobacteria bacterium]|nr:MAG: recombinase A [Acidobacteriota bacterium]
MRSARALAPARPRRGAFEPRWRLAEVSGRLVELSGEGPAAWLTFAFALVAESQRRGEPAAWVTVRGTSFYPPDAARDGIDLAALPVVFAPHATAAARAAERLVRSGGFGVVVIDLVGVRPELPPALLSRLAGLAERHEAAVVCLTEKPAAAPSLGPLVSLRCEVRRDDPAGHAFTCRATALRDKRRGQPWADVEVCRGPAGLC